MNIALLIGVLVLLMLLYMNNESYIIPDVKNKLGFNIAEDPDSAHKTVDYMITCGTVNDVVPDPNFSFKYGVAQMNCGDHSFVCPGSSATKRTSVLSPENNALICVYPQ